jgi:hypothetical protein
MILDAQGKEIVKCDHIVVVTKGMLIYNTETVVCTGECSEGCCDYFKCKICGKRWKVEHS